MSRIGRLPIAIPSGVDVKLDGRQVDVYKVFTTAFDEVVDAADLCDPVELDRLRALLDGQLAILSSVVSRLANKLQRRLLAQQNRSWVFDLEEGMLDTARLTRIVTEPAIYRSAGTLYHQAGLDIQGERIGLPLADDGINCDGVLGVSDYQDPNLSGPFELITEKETWLSLR